MKTLAKYHACNHWVIDEKTFKNILIGPGKLPGLSRNGPLGKHSLVLSAGRHVTRSKRGKIFSRC